MEDYNFLKTLNIFITPTGGMLVIPSDETIEEYAEIYNVLVLKYDLERIFEQIKSMNDECTSMKLSYSELLINVLGYALYENGEIRYPDPFINNKCLTGKQLAIINNLLGREDEIKILDKLNKQKKLKYN